MVTVRANADEIKKGNESRVIVKPTDPLRGPMVAEKGDHNVAITAVRRHGAPAYSGGAVVWDVDVANRTKTEQKASAIVQIWSGDRYTAEVTLKQNESKTVSITDPLGQSTNLCNAQPFRAYLAGDQQYVDLTQHEATPKLACTIATHVDNPWATNTSARAGKVVVDGVSLSTTTPTCNAKVHWKVHVSNNSAQNASGSVGVFKTTLGTVSLAPGKSAEIEGDVPYLGGLHDVPMLDGDLAASPTVPIVQAQGTCSLTLDAKF